MEINFIELLSNGGLIVVGAYLVYFLTKRYRELENFINNRLVQVIENNTKVIQNLILVINDMRHEINSRLDKIEVLIEKSNKSKK